MELFGNTKELSIEELIKKIKLKGTLKALPDFYVNKEIQDFKRTRPRADFKEIFKEVRKRLHESYGAFQTRRKKKRLLYLEELKLAIEENWDKPENEEMKKIRQRILETNVSSRERLEADYEKLYNELKGEVGHELKTIMDLGSGINPVLFQPDDFKKVKILAYDIDKNDVDFLNKYFKVMRLDGVAKVLDIHDLKAVEKLPRVDVALLYKIIDPLERRGHKFSEMLIQKIKSKYLIVSFATRTISRKPMNHPQRGWFEAMVKRLGMKYKTIKTKNEIYYVVKKK